VREASAISAQAEPLVSVIIPLFNQEKFVAQALASVFAQGMQALEVIVVDDGSTDRSATIVEDYARTTGERIHLIRQPNSGGPAKPRNVGIQHASGQFVAFLDPDDYWYPEKLSQQLDTLTNFESVAMVFGNPHVVDVAGAVLNSYLNRVNYLQRAMPHLQRVGEHIYLSTPSFFAFSSADVAGPLTSNVMVRRSALFAEPAWFPTDMRVGEDLDLWFRLMQKHKVVFIDQPLCAYRQHAESLMHQPALSMAGSAVCHERNYSRAGDNLTTEQKQRYRRRIAGIHASMGYAAWRAGNNREARIAYVTAWRWNKSVAHLLAWAKAWMHPSAVAALRALQGKAKRRSPAD